MHRRPLRFLQSAAATVIGLVLLAIPALAQDTFREPGIIYLDDEKPYIQWIAGVLIVLACLLIALKNPHRSHTD